MLLNRSTLLTVSLIILLLGNNAAVSLHLLEHIESNASDIHVHQVHFYETHAAHVDQVHFHKAHAHAAYVHGRDILSDSDVDETCLDVSHYQGASFYSAFEFLLLSPFNTANNPYFTSTFVAANGSDTSIRAPPMFTLFI